MILPWRAQLPDHFELLKVKGTLLPKFYSARRSAAYTCAVTSELDSQRTVNHPTYAGSMWRALVRQSRRSTQKPILSAGPSRQGRPGKSEARAESPGAHPIDGFDWRQVSKGHCVSDAAP